MSLNTIDLAALEPEEFDRLVLEHMGRVIHARLPILLEQDTFWDKLSSVEKDRRRELAGDCLAVYRLLHQERDEQAAKKRKQRR